MLYFMEQIGLFGSYARDEATKNSDIDMVAIKEQIESDLHTKVDIIRKHKNIKPFFLQMKSTPLIRKNLNTPFKLELLVLI